MSFTEILNLIIKHILIIFIGIGIVLGIYSIKFFVPFMLWLKGGIEDGDKKLENKELQLAFFSLLSAFMVVSVALWQTEYPTIMIACTFGGAGILYAVNRGASAYELTHPPKEKKKKNQDPPKEDFDENLNHY